MARSKPEPRYQWVNLPDCDWWTDAKVQVWTNAPLRAIAMLDSDKPGSVLEYLGTIIKSWEGFDEPFSTKALAEFTAEELNEFVPHLQEAITNPR